jgi:ABC-type multidrug transport system fused ATPase/permease subunit
MLTGLGAVFVEVGFAQGLQALLIALGVGSQSVLYVPKWLDSQNLYPVAGILFFIGIARGLIQWASASLQYAAKDEFSTLQRSRITQFAFHSESVSTAKISDLFGEACASSGFILMSIQAIMIQLTTAGFLYVSLCVIAFKITFFVTLILASLYLPLRLMDKNVQKSSRQISAEWVRLNDQLFSSIKNLLLMQIYGTQSLEEQKVQRGLQEFHRHSIYTGKITGFKFALPQTLGVTLICCLAISTRHSMGLSTSVVLSYLYIFARFIQNFSDVIRNLSTVAVYGPALTRLYHWWRDEYKFDSSLSSDLKSPLIELAEPTGWLLQNVGFRYVSSGKPVFENLNLEIRPGTNTIITGASGRGKSTLLQLLLGLLEPQEGEVRLIHSGDEGELISHSRARLLASIGYVGPESFLLEGTVRSNLTYGLKTVPSDGEIWEALKKADSQFLADMPDQLDHKLTEQGHGLSAGQKQRIALGRALLRNPKILILDEATSNLDTATESRLVETFAQLKGTMTLVAVTHRESLASIADQVVRL